jgi:two-component system, LytTR family, response regulator
MTKPIPTFIVDDEPLARERISHLLREEPAVEIVGSYGSVTEAAQFARTLRPRLLFLDVRMPQQDGFQLLKVLTREGINPYVIIVTAYSDRPMDAFASGAVDYLLKPLDRTRFARALERAKRLIAAEPHLGAKQTAAVPGLASNQARLLLAKRGKVIVLATHDIEFIQAVAKSVKIYAAGRCHSHRQSLGELEASLDAKMFVRVHRSTIVNVEHISEMHSLFHGDYELILKRGTRLTLSRRYRDRLAPFFWGSASLKTN